MHIYMHPVPRELKTHFFSIQKYKKVHILFMTTSYVLPIVDFATERDEWVVFK